ncbi:MAG: NAD(P)H-binding protein [Proteobacteria bacterium]|nr:NAD(P)H-binding protein [Pseudomonadota bacterium]
MILVSGANGRLGRRIVQHLIARSPAPVAGRLAVSVSEPTRAADLASRGVEIRHGDFDQPATLAHAFTGVERLILTSTHGPRPQRIARHRQAIAAAREAGVQHVFYVSLLDVAADSPAEYAAVHLEAESALADSGLTHTVLRNTLYADDLPLLAGPALRDGILALPAGEGTVSLVSRDELAQAMAAAALAPRLEKHVYELTGQVASSFAAIAGKIARVGSQPLRYAAIAEADYVAAQQQAGLPAWLAIALGNLFRAVAEGRFAHTGNDFAALVGHPPKSLDCMIHEYFTPRSVS